MLRRLGPLHWKTVLSPNSQPPCICAGNSTWQYSSEGSMLRPPEVPEPEGCPFGVGFEEVAQQGGIPCQQHPHLQGTGHAGQR
jgi:hypothetical protein